MALSSRALARPEVFFLPVEFAVLYDGGGLPVVEAVSGVDEVAVHARHHGSARVCVWERAGTVTYTNLESGARVEGAVRHRIAWALDRFALNADGSMTSTRTDPAGVTALELTFDADGELIEVVTRSPAGRATPRRGASAPAPAR